MKGQNLRIFLDNRVVAASTNCNLHLNMQTQEVASKDDADLYTRILPVSLSWDCTVDSLVVDTTRVYEYVIDGARVSINGKVYYKSIRSYDLPPRHTVYVIGNDDVAIISGSTILASGNKSTSYKNTGSTPVTVYVGHTDALSAAAVAVDDSGAWSIAELIDEMLATNGIEVAFSEAGGLHNRELSSSDIAYTGMANITDITLNAAKGNLPTFSAKLTGRGALVPQE